jgi:PhnB protein
MTQANDKTHSCGMETITPHIVVQGAARAAEWYKQALGAQERGQRIAVPGGKFIHIELWFGNSAVMVADEFPEMNICSPQTVGGTSTVLMLTTNDVDTLWQQALEAGAQVFHPLANQFWGDRQGQIIDPFGHRWGLAQHIREVTHSEIARAAAEAFGAPSEGRE